MTLVLDCPACGHPGPDHEVVFRYGGPPTGEVLGSVTRSESQWGSPIIRRLEPGEALAQRSIIVDILCRACEEVCIEEAAEFEQPRDPPVMPLVPGDQGPSP